MPLLFNPFAIDEMAEAIHQAIEMAAGRAEEANAADAIGGAGQQRLPVGGQDPVRPAQVRYARGP